MTDLPDADAPARVSLRADTAELATLGRALGLALATVPDAPADLAMRVELVAVELFTNAVRHGGASRIDVSVKVQGDEVRLGIEDDGVPFDPRVGERSVLGELRDGGFGLAIVDDIAVLRSYARHQGLNRVDLAIPFVRRPA